MFVSDLKTLLLFCFSVYFFVGFLFNFVTWGLNYAIIHYCRHSHIFVSRNRFYLFFFLFLFLTNLYCYPQEMTSQCMEW